MPGAEEVWEVAVTQTAMNHIERKKANVSQWLALWTLFEVCTGKKGYKGGGYRRESQWSQMVEEKQLWETLEEKREARSRRKHMEGVMQW